ncbi:dTDP-4-keto-6-deoxy-D-glucose epimerase [bacterium]|nr:dTDP-4-keto-6-deoxy-D-glucose epimerase [Candidatus Elulimicrobium humile]
MMQELSLHGLKLINLERKIDNRGWFSETYKENWLKDFGIDTDFIFEFWSYNNLQGTLRGLHSQNSKFVPAKLIMVLTGSIQDVVVDARINSPTYGQHVSVTLDSKTPQLLFVPKGLYHGFVTLEPNTFVGYKVDEYHAPNNECGVDYNDKSLNINWKIKDNLIISDRDLNNPSWENCYKFDL